MLPHLPSGLVGPSQRHTAQPRVQKSVTSWRARSSTLIGVVSRDGARAVTSGQPGTLPPPKSVPGLTSRRWSNPDRLASILGQQCDFVNCAAATLDRFLRKAARLRTPRPPTGQNHNCNSNASGTSVDFRRWSDRSRRLPLHRYSAPKPQRWSGAGTLQSLRKARLNDAERRRLRVRGDRPASVNRRPNRTLGGTWPPNRAAVRLPSLRQTWRLSSEAVTHR